MTTSVEEQIRLGIAQVKDQAEAWFLAQVEPLREENERLAAEVSRMAALQNELRRGDLLRSHGDRSLVQSGKYRGMDALDLALVGSLIRCGLKNAGPDYRMLPEWRENFRLAALDSTTAGTGDELVPTLEASEIWMDVNLDTPVLALFSRVEMPSNPFDIPLQLGDVNWYPGTENVATKSTAVATGKNTLTAYELVSEVPWSLTLEEDAVIAMMPEVRMGLVRNTREVIDDVLLNADVTAANGINSDGATITAADAGKAQWLLGFDGILKLPLVDNASQANNHNAAVSDDMFNEVRSKIGKYGVKPSELAYLLDVNTYIRCLTVGSFRTLDKLGPLATVLTGQLGAVEGIPVIVSEQMKLADTDGKVTDSGNATDTGRLCITNTTQWRTGFRREMSIETERDIQKRQNVMVVSFRIAFMERSGARSSATHTALQYQITGVS